MSVPKSVVRFKKDNVEYISSVDKCEYTMRELTRAAMRDVGKYITRLCNIEAQKLPGMKKSKRVRGKSSAFQYWARKNECDLQVGIKHDTWYGVNQELGTSKMKQHNILTSTVTDHIDKIVEIESQYLEYMEDEAKALNCIDEDEHIGSDNEES